MKPLAVTDFQLSAKLEYPQITSTRKANDDTSHPEN